MKCLIIAVYLILVSVQAKRFGIDAIADIVKTTVGAATGLVTSAAADVNTNVLLTSVGADLATGVSTGLGVAQALGANIANGGAKVRGGYGSGCGSAVPHKSGANIAVNEANTNQAHSNTEDNAVNNSIHKEDYVSNVHQPKASGQDMETLTKVAKGKRVKPGKKTYARGQNKYGEQELN